MRPRTLAKIAVLGAVAAGAVDACAVEPYAVEATRHLARAPVRAPLVVAHLTDLHSRGLGRRERAMLGILQESRADVVVLTGDVVDSGHLEDARPVLERIRAPLGVFVVRGNWEHWRPPAEDERRFYASVGATLLVNEGRLLRDDVWLAGLGDPLAGAPSLLDATRDAPADGVARIALFHSPEIFDMIAARVDLAFAGHTHGGQVRLPGIGALWRPPGSGRFDAGWYEAGRARMYVSRGVGTSMVDVRLACRPEVAIVEISP